MPEVFVGVGSNVDRQRNLAAGIMALREAFGPLHLSAVWDNPAKGFEGDDFLNLVAVIQTESTAREVYDALHIIEDRFGRRRTPDTKMVSRTLDLDLLLYGDAVISEGKLQVPRGEILDYAFVLCPLAELAPDRVHPVTGRTYAELWRDFPGDRDSLKRVILDL